MSWENRFSTMVKESSVKIDEAKRRLYNSDATRNAVGPYTAALPPSVHSTLQAVNHDVTRRDHPTFDSLLLLHTLCEKTERQSQICELLKTKVETLEATISKQDNDMENLKEQLSEVYDKVDQWEQLNTQHTLEEWKSEIKNEIYMINLRLRQNDQSDLDLKSTMPRSKRYRAESAMENKEWVGNGFNEIKNRILDIIELELSSYHRYTEMNSKMVDKNILSLTHVGDSNKQHLERLTKLQDASVDEINHVKTTLSGMQEKVHELEGAIKDLSRSEIKSKNFVDDISPISENKSPSEIHLGHISISSDEQHQNSLTDWSINLDESDDLSFDDLNIEQDIEHRTSNHKRPDNSELLDSSLDSFQDLKYH